MASKSVWPTLNLPHCDSFRVDKNLWALHSVFFGGNLHGWNYWSVYTEILLEEVSEMGYQPLRDPRRGEICVRGNTLFVGYHKDPE